MSEPPLDPPESPDDEMVTSEFPEVIQAHLDYLDESRKACLDLVPAATAVEEVIARFPDLTTRVNYGSTYLHFAVFYQQDVAAAVPILRELAKRGFSQSRKPKTDTSSKTRDWMCGKIKLILFFGTGEDATCRFVKVGEKKSVEPVYELQCDGKPVEESVEVATK